MNVPWPQLSREPRAAKRLRHSKVNMASAVRWPETFVHGQTPAKPIGGDQRSHTIEAQADLIRQTYEAQPELYLHELCDRSDVGF